MYQLKKHMNFLQKIRDNYLPYVSIVAALYWFVPLWIKIYDFKLLSAVYEIAWLPMVILLFVLPMVSIFSWKKEGYPTKSKNLISLFLNLVTLLVLLLKK